MSEIKKYLDLAVVEVLVNQIKANFVTADEANHENFVTNDKLAEKVADAGFPTTKNVEDIAAAKVAEVVGGAPEAFDTLKEIADALKDNDDAVAAINNTLATKASKEEVTAEIADAVKDAVNFKEFTYTNSIGETATRKTIQLNNYDTISGISTTGEGYNLVMLSKWDVADFGSRAIHFNINSKDGNVTINDHDFIATQAYVDAKFADVTVPQIETITNEEIIALFEPKVGE